MWIFVEAGFRQWTKVRETIGLCHLLNVVEIDWTIP